MNESRLIKETQIMQQSNWYKWLQLNQCNQHFLVTCGLYRSEAIYVHLSCPGDRLTSIWIIVQMQVYNSHYNQVGNVRRGLLNCGYSASQKRNQTKPKLINILKCARTVCLRNLKWTRNIMKVPTELMKGGLSYKGEMYTWTTSPNLDLMIQKSCNSSCRPQQHGE